MVQAEKLDTGILLTYSDLLHHTRTQRPAANWHGRESKHGKIKDFDSQERHAWEMQNIQRTPKNAKDTIEMKTLFSQATHN